MLSQQGLRHQLTSSDCQDRARNALLVACRWPLQRVAPTPTSKEPAEPCRWLPVEIDAPEPFILGAMHVPNRVTGRKYPFLEALLRQAARWRESQAILIGDTNSGVPGIDEESPAFNGVEGRWLGAIDDAGWREAFRAHAGRRRAYTCVFAQWRQWLPPGSGLPQPGDGKPTGASKLRVGRWITSIGCE
jgi:exonuclease III